MDMAMANEDHPQDAPPLWMGSSYNLRMPTRITRICSIPSTSTGIGEMLLLMYSLATAFYSLGDLIISTESNPFSSIKELSSNSTIQCSQQVSIFSIRSYPCSPSSVSQQQIPIVT